MAKRKREQLPTDMQWVLTRIDREVSEEEYGSVPEGWGAMLRWAKGGGRKEFMSKVLARRFGSQQGSEGAGGSEGADEGSVECIALVEKLLEGKT